MVETTRRFEQDINQFQANLGLEGSFNEIDWELTFSKGHRTRSDQDFGQFNGARLIQAMGPSADLDGNGTPECYTDIADPATLIADCVPFNFFGGPGSVTADQIAWVSTNLNDTYVEDLEEAGFGFTGSLFELPGGELGWAAGFGYRGASYQYRADSNKIANAVTGSVGESSFGTLYSTGYYVELLAPVFDNGTQSLDLKGGARYDGYNLFDGETTWSFGAEFQVIESLKLRGTVGTVFRAPTMEDLFQGLADNAPTYGDPCFVADPADLPPGCAQIPLDTPDPQAPARIGGNENVVPETGDTFTVGAVWEPGFAEGLSMTVDYWKTDIENGISTYGVQYIMDDCYIRQNQASCDLITRTSEYALEEVIDTAVNVSEQGAEGVDTEIRYAFETSFGDFDAAVLWAYLIERYKKQSPISDIDYLAGRFIDDTVEDGGGYPRNKINYSLQWTLNDLTVGYLGEYIHHMTSDGTPGFSDDYTYETEDLLYHDLTGSYSFGQGTSIAAGVTNLTDEEPPFIAAGFNANTSPEMYRMLGMGYYLRLSHEFE